MIVVVLPSYNEVDAMPRLLGRLREAAATITEPMRCVVVDDGSSDGTAGVAEREHTDAVPLTVVRHAVNRGLHGALDTGLRTAAELCGPGDWIVTMDADDTHPPSLIALMLQAAAAENAGVVIASRFRPGAEWFGLSWERLLFSHTVSWMFRIAWPMRGVRDYTCGFRAYRADLIRCAYERWGDDFVNEPSFACMPDVLWKVSRLRPVICEVPLSLHYDRKPGPSKMNVARTIRRTLGLIVKRRVGIAG